MAYEVSCQSRGILGAFVPERLWLVPTRLSLVAWQESHEYLSSLGGGRFDICREDGMKDMPSKRTRL